MKYDFSGYATRNNLRCSDGRTILKDAFVDSDGRTVPLVWNHQHSEPENVIGHAQLENREDGVYAYCTFNETEGGKVSKVLVEHGDISALSIYANQLKHRGSNVTHGAIREVSLVLAGANPGAFIDSVISHGEESEEEAIIYTGEEIALYHSDENEKENKDDKKDDDKKDAEKTNDNEKHDDKTKDDETMKDVLGTLNEKQKNVLYTVVAEALEQKDDENKGGTDTMKHNVFDQEDQTKENTLSHSDVEAIISDAKRYGSLKESALQHGITNIDYLFPEAKSLNTPPEFISREMGWVQKVMSGTHHTPFSRIKSVFADITEAEARAKGYIKGNLKKDEVFGLLKRTTTPTTVYKKQKLDRDDVIDITDFDVVAWLKSEMRIMLDEELARAYLVGDGRLASSDDKINEQNIRPIWKDDDLYCIKKTFSGGENKAREFIKAAIKARKNYKGTGNPTLFTTEDMLTDCLLLTDNVGRDLYESEAKLATKLRVKEIVTVPVMENLTREVEGETHTLEGIIVNLTDYNVGADKGGAVNMFDDFDIDYNAQKYLIETRCSGALIKPYSAIALESIEGEEADGEGAGMFEDEEE